MLNNIKIGLGCMPLSGCYGAISAKDATHLIQKAFDLGIIFFDTADNYGHHRNEELLKEAIKPFKNQVFVSTKVGIKNFDGNITIDGSKKYIKQACEASLKRLDKDCIDLVFYHHLDKLTPIEETIYALSELVHQGMIKHIGLFEMELSILKKAHAIHPIFAYQAEYSLITQGAADTIIPFCKEHEIIFMANAPLARGLLSNNVSKFSCLEAQDIRSLFPRFQSPHLEQNIKSIEKLKQFADHHNMTLPQVALIWLLEKKICPIFGTTNKKHLEENFKALNLSLNPQSLNELNSLLASIVISKQRLPDSAKKLYLDF